MNSQAVSAETVANIVQRAKMKFESRAVEDIISTLRTFTDLKALFTPHQFPDGITRWCVSLSGTIPIIYKGATYHIPVALYLMDNHPYSGPYCYVCPTSTMRIRVSETVDEKGRIYLPYLTEWRYPGHDTSGLLQVMTIAFQEKSPMYSISSKPSSNHSSNNSNSMPHLSTNPNPPYPVAANQDPVTPYPTAALHAMPQPNSQAPYPIRNTFPSSQYPTQQQPQPYQPTLGTSGGYQPPYQQISNAFSNPNPSLASASSEPPKHGGMNAYGTIQSTHIRASLISAVEDKIRSRLREKIGKPFAELQSVDVNLKELRIGEQKLRDMLEKLENDQTQLDIIIANYQDKKEELEKALGACNGNGSAKNEIDDAIDATTPLHRQIFRCYVQDCAIDDTIYFLGQALKRGIINVQTYLKYVRQLSRKQFVQRATMQKCRLKAKLPI